ncbi:TPA: YlmC/YmxH family sporulation protein [bacterium]|jgi:YlmC/YmxH family sporulation protein|nr:YlmC/YmxH family sporulation protein [bacterium]
MRYSELQLKDVVNVNNGQKVGTVVDLIISNEGKIDALVIERSIWGKIYRTLGGKNSTIVPYSNVTSIGADIIFINLE